MPQSSAAARAAPVPGQDHHRLGAFGGHGKAMIDNAAAAGERAFLGRRADVTLKLSTPRK